MNILIAFVALAVILLAVDLFTAPKHAETSSHAGLKGRRRAA